MTLVYQLQYDTGAGSDALVVAVSASLDDTGEGREENLAGDWDGLHAEQGEWGEGADVASLPGESGPSDSGEGSEEIAIYRGDLFDPFTDQRPHTSKLYLAVRTPRIIWKGRVGDDRADIEDMTLAYTAGGDTAGFDLDDFGVDLTMWIGTSDGLQDQGRCRFRELSGNAAGTIKVAADASCTWEQNDYICITDVHELWPRHHKVEDSGGSLEVWKDNDIPANERKREPVPIMGPPACEFLDAAAGTVTINFDGSRSYHVPTGFYPQAYLGTDPQKGIVSYSWWFEGGNPGSSSNASVNVVWNTPGRYVVSLEVTNINGDTYKGFRDVFIFNDANPPVHDFSVDDFVGSMDRHSWEAQLEVWGDANDLDNLGTGALVVLFSEDKYGGQTYSLDPFFPGREKIKLVGWIAESRIFTDSAGSNVSLQVNGLGKYLEKFNNFPVYFTALNTDAPDWSYIEELTLSQILYHLIRWHWVLVCFTDVHVLLRDCYLGGHSFPAGSIKDELDSFVVDIQSFWTTNRWGGLSILRKGDYSLLGEDPPIHCYLEEEDIESIEIEPRSALAPSAVRVLGIVTDYDNGDIVSTPVESTIPESTQGFSGGVLEVGSQVLPGNFFAAYLAHRIYAREARLVHRVRVTLTGNWSVIDLVPLYRIYLTYQPSEALRGINWDNEAFWIVEVSNTVDVEHGAIQTSCVLVPAVDLAADEYTVHSLIGDDLFPSLSPLPVPAPVLIPEDVLIPATVNSISGTFSWGSRASVWLRNDSRAEVWATNPGFKVWADRPMEVLFSDGKYTILRPLDNEDYGEQEESVLELQSVFQQAVWTYPGPLSLYESSVGSPEIVGPALYTLPDETMYLMNAHTYARTCPTSADGQIWLYIDGVYEQIIGYVQVGSHTYEWTSFTPIAFSSRTRLELAIPVAGTDPAEDVTVSLLIKQMGI